MKYNFAIMGAGSIAQRMGETVQKTDIVNGYAVASRDLSRAQNLADKYGFCKAYGSYDEMLADPAVDLVYIATPHVFHASQIEQCLRAGKHVLCEKSFTINADQARRVTALAQKKGLLLAEAIWPRYMPMAKTLREFAASDKIGKIHSLTANLGYPVYHREPAPRPQSGRRRPAGCRNLSPDLCFLDSWGRGNRDLLVCKPQRNWSR
mgnify:CR=1 FL=1